MQMSIVMPAFNNQEALNRSLETLEAQVRRHALECIVVDDGSAVPIVVPGWCKLHRIDRSPVSRGSSAAKNAGAALAEGDTLVFIDSDILCLKDTLLSLLRAMDEREKEGMGNSLLNVMRVSLPENYPKSRMKDTEKLLVRCRKAGILHDEHLKQPMICWEQNVGMIRKALFDELGGYDEEAFKSWGLNNQDLGLRVILSGGHVSSWIKRTINNYRLFCFHPWHPACRSLWHRDKEFKDKWGVAWSDKLAMEAYGAAADGRVGKRSAVQAG